LFSNVKRAHLEILPEFTTPLLVATVFGVCTYRNLHSDCRWVTYTSHHYRWERAGTWVWCVT